jgi:DNA-binding GntR family transcriptional regulator
MVKWERSVRHMSKFDEAHGDDSIQSAGTGQEKETQRDVAYRGLKKLILDGSLPAGAQLLELEAAERLGTSRTPIREAMIRLREEGMVDIRPRHGMRVLPISADDMREIYQVLTGLEGEAAYIVAERGLSKQEKSALDQAVKNMNLALKRDDLLAWAAADESFHSLLVEYSRNRRLINLVSQLWDQAHRARILTLRMRPKPINSNLEHEALVDAIAGGDPEAAQKIHQDHRKRAGAMLVKLLQEMGPTQV